MRTLTLQLNVLPGYTGSGTVVVGVTSTGYTLTIKVEGMDPNSRHVVNIHAGSCAAIDSDSLVQLVDLAHADANGTFTTARSYPEAYAIPKDGRVLTVHGTSGTDADHAHIACADLTN